jgi:hypothetical protein
MHPDDAYEEDLARRLLSALPLPLENHAQLLIAVNPECLGGARIEWEEPGHWPMIRTDANLVERLTEKEFDALCAHEHRHLAGWWGMQRGFCLQNEEHRERLLLWAFWPFVTAVRWVFEFQSDAFAATFAGTRHTEALLRKVQKWGRENSAPWREHFRQPHPPYLVRIAALRLLRQER